MNWFELVTKLLGGLAIFLFGLDQMADALKALAGQKLKVLLGRLTNNRLLGLTTGAITTAVIQSSSVTTVLVIGFISAGLMDLSQAIGVIMGANIGTTITPYLATIKVTKSAFIIVFIGYTLQFLGAKKIQTIGNLVLGLGLIFLGMNLMSSAMSPLRTYEPFHAIMEGLASPILGITLGAIFTALVQSSSASIIVFVTLASQGLISLESSIGLVLGANIGTCITALLASIGKPREAVRAAIAHTSIKCIGVAVWIWFIPTLTEIASTISPTHPELEGRERMAAEIPLQVANVHMVFNILNTLVLVWFSSPLAYLITKLLPNSTESTDLQPRYLDPQLISTPPLALEVARNEIKRVGKRINKMMENILPAIINGSETDLEKIRDIDDEIDMLYRHLVKYLGDISQQELSDEDSQQVFNFLSAINNLEAIGDIIDKNLVSIGLGRIEKNITISATTTEVLAKFHNIIAEALDTSINALVNRDTLSAMEVVQLKRKIRKAAHQANTHQANRLLANEPDRLQTYALETDIIDNLRRIYSYAKRIARTVNDIERGDTGMSDSFPAVTE